MKTLIEPTRIENDQFKTTSDRTNFVKDIFKYFEKHNMEMNTVRMRSIADSVTKLLKNEKQVNT